MKKHRKSKISKLCRRKWRLAKASAGWRSENNGSNESQLNWRKMKETYQQKYGVEK
jgi:hypothetical protein